jgi:hypothetical protein
LDYSLDAGYFFSGPPYRSVTVTELGYLNPNRFVIDEDTGGLNVILTETNAGPGKRLSVVVEIVGDCLI